MERKVLDEFIWVIDDFWTADECASAIEQSEAIGYELAKINTYLGQKVNTDVRNNSRVMFKDELMAERLWLKLADAVPNHFGNSKAIGLNEMFRFYRYLPGQEFKWHHDESYIRSENEASYFTFMIYLNDDFSGGETTFKTLSIKPQKGMALIFLHQLEHTGAAVTEGVKYVLRTDIMFKLND